MQVEEIYEIADRDAESAIREAEKLPEKDTGKYINRWEMFGAETYSTRIKQFGDGNISDYIASFVFCYSARAYTFSAKKVLGDLLYSFVRGFFSQAMKELNSNAGNLFESEQKIERLSSEIKRLHNELKNQAYSSELKKQLGLSDSSVAYFQQKTVEAEMTIENLSAEVARLQTELKGLKEQAPEPEKKTRQDSGDGKIKSLTAELEETRQALEALRGKATAADRVISDLRSENNQLKAKLKKMGQSRQAAEAAKPSDKSVQPVPLPAEPVQSQPVKDEVAVFLKAYNESLKLDTRSQWESALSVYKPRYVYLSMADMFPYVLEEGNKSAWFIAAESPGFAGFSAIVPSFSCTDILSHNVRKLYDVRQGEGGGRQYRIVKPVMATLGQGNVYSVKEDGRGVIEC